MSAGGARVSHENPPLWTRLVIELFAEPAQRAVRPPNGGLTAQGALVLDIVLVHPAPTPIPVMESQVFFSSLTVYVSVCYIGHSGPVGKLAGGKRNIGLSDV